MQWAELEDAPEITDIICRQYLHPALRLWSPRKPLGVVVAHRKALNDVATQRFGCRLLLRSPLVFFLFDNPGGNSVLAVLNAIAVHLNHNLTSILDSLNACCLPALDAYYNLPHGDSDLNVVWVAASSMQRACIMSPITADKGPSHSRFNRAASTADGEHSKRPRCSLYQDRER
jgi:hypothetical protein